jgi:hypothetical protein
MKKLNKLQINSEKIMKNEVLLSLKGGYDGGGSCCKCYLGAECLGYMAAWGQEDCTSSCRVIDPACAGTWGTCN